MDVSLDSSDDHDARVARLRALLGLGAAGRFDGCGDFLFLELDEWKQMRDRALHHVETDLRVGHLPAGTWHRMNWRILVKERIANIVKLEDSFSPQKVVTMFCVFEKVRFCWVFANQPTMHKGGVRELLKKNAA